MKNIDKFIEQCQIQKLAICLIVVLMHEVMFQIAHNEVQGNFQFIFKIFFCCRMQYSKYLFNFKGHDHVLHRVQSLVLDLVQVICY